ncbi:MAG: hypothetical protein L7W43_20065, partial [Rubripirellula sp.]|nr:hypothetical protein [Rubripirellula sp.]
FRFILTKVTGWTVKMPRPSPGWHSTNETVIPNALFGSRTTSNTRVFTGSLLTRTTSADAHW